MKVERKTKIDELWKNTEYGQWILLASKGNNKEADALAQKMIGKYPFSLDAIGKELSKKIAKEINGESEFDEYLETLDSEDYELVEFLISNDTFGKVYDYLKEK